jgi:hypothetical protein
MRAQCLDAGCRTLVGGLCSFAIDLIDLANAGFSFGKIPQQSLGLEQGLPCVPALKLSAFTNALCFSRLILSYSKLLIFACHPLTNRRAVSHL